MIYRILISIVTITVIYSAGLQAAEKDYQVAWCTGKGQAEVRLPDRTRIDCLTDTHAVEFDWGYKWAECIGQALHYAANTGKRAGCALIVATTEHRYTDRVRRLIAHYGLPIDLFIINK